MFKMVNKVVLLLFVLRGTKCCDLSHPLQAQGMNAVITHQTVTFLRCSFRLNRRKNSWRKKGNRLTYLRITRNRYLAVSTCH